MIRQLTLAEVQKWDYGSARNPGYPQQAPAPGARVPTLDQVLDLASRGTLDFRTLLAMKKLAPEIRLSALYAGPPRDFVAIAREAGAGIVSPEKSLVTPEQVRAAHQAGLRVIPWTANTPEQWGRLIRAGVDATIGDGPAALIEQFRTRALH